MGAKNRFSILRKLLGTIGLSPEAVDDIIDRITDFLSDEGDKSAGEAAYPYVLSRDFLTSAGHNFFSVLKTMVADQALISVKVGLGDLFDVKLKDPTEFRIYRNTIDRKHGRRASSFMTRIPFATSAATAAVSSPTWEPWEAG